MLNRGFVWIAQNNSTTDYIELSRLLAKSIKKYNPDITMILITHRLSSLNICDEIVVLMKDQVILKNKKDTNLKQLEKILEGIDVKKYD